MTIGATLRFGFGVFAVGAMALLVGCGNDDPGGEGGSDPSDDADLVFVPGQGQVVAPRLAYPEGPKGFDIGSVIENFRWVGYVNSQNNPSGTMQLIQLADFYNPTGTDVWGPNQAYPEGSPKPKALLLDVASVWCGPCNTEAKSILPGLYELYKPQGGEFLLQLADGPEGGVPATNKNLDNWVNKYDVDYPAVLDPAYKLGALFEAEAYPQNFIIDTRTMTIVEIFPGAPEPGGAFWKKFEKTLAGE